MAWDATMQHYWPRRPCSGPGSRSKTEDGRIPDCILGGSLQPKNLADRLPVVLVKHGNPVSKIETNAENLYES
eukprot:1155471-Pelagomonas_calceolata.AAC.3